MTTPLPPGPPNQSRDDESDGAPKAARPTALLRPSRFGRHDTGDHPENQSRIAAIESALLAADFVSGRPEIAFDVAPIAALARVHAQRFLDLLRDLTERGGAWLDNDTMVGPDSFETARLVSGAVIASIDAVLAGTVQRAFILGRPPGHHATTDRGMGFCLLNHVAIGAAHALASGADRVAVVDWDVHHGNGTQDIFSESDRVLVCSVHQSPLYPGTGAASERGRGPGEGFTLNIPLPPRQGDDIYEAIFTETVLPTVRAFNPDLILVSAGFDAHRADPIGGMHLSEAGFATLATLVAGLANQICGGRVVAVLEGGYDPPALARSVLAVLAALDRSGTTVRRQDGK